MNQLRQLLKSLSLRQRISLAVVTALVFAGIYAFSRWSHEQDFKPLYSSLSAEDAGAIIAKLKETGTEYRVAEGSSSILVPSKRIPELRLQMASSGIPKSGRIGYELFDRTNLGVTDFSEQVNYHRAVEGELERSVMAMNEVEQARVHITFPKDSVFTEAQQPAKASVMVKLKPGAKLSSANAQAIAQLAASAVEGLTPEGVSVLDMQGNLLIRSRKKGDGSEPSDEFLAWKKQLETETLAKISTVLDALLGADKYRASIELDLDQTSGEQSEETYDPTHSVITNSQRTEEGAINRETAGVPGTQSNPPRPAPRAAGAVGGGLARRTENMNYETSRTVRKLRLPQGIVRRMSVSVVIDHKLRWEPGKGKGAQPRKIIEPLSADELKVIREVVASASGFNTNRGDQLTVNSLPFEATLNARPPSDMLPAPVSGKTPGLGQRFPLPVLIGSGVALVLLGAAVFLFLRSRRKKASALPAAGQQLKAAQEAGALPAGATDGTAPHQVGGTEQGTPSSSVLAGKAAERHLSQMKESFKLPVAVTTKLEVLTKQLTDEAQKDPVAMAQIVRTWLNEPKK